MQFDELKELIDNIISEGDGFKYTYYKLNNRRYLMVERFTSCVVDDYLMINDTDGNVTAWSYNKRDLDKDEILGTIEEMRNEIQKVALEA